MIRVVVFDIGNVLLQFDHRLINERFARAAGMDVGRVNALFAETPLEHQFETGAITADEFYRQVCALLGLTVSFTDFAAWWSDIFTPVPGMKNLLNRVKQQPCRLAILSNTNVLHFEHIKKHYPEIAFFDRYFLSYELHCRKPEPAIFTNVIAACDIPATDIAFLDDIPAHIVAAQAAGITAAVFTGADQAAAFLRSQGLPV